MEELGDVPVVPFMGSVSDMGLVPPVSVPLLHGDWTGEDFVGVGDAEHVASVPCMGPVFGGDFGGLGDSTVNSFVRSSGGSFLISTVASSPLIKKTCLSSFSTTTTFFSLFTCLLLDWSLQCTTVCAAVCVLVC